MRRRNIREKRWRDGWLTRPHPATEAAWWRDTVLPTAAPGIRPISLEFGNRHWNVKFRRPRSLIALYLKACVWCGAGFTSAHQSVLATRDEGGELTTTLRFSWPISVASQPTCVAVCSVCAACSVLSRWTRDRWRSWIGFSCAGCRLSARPASALGRGGSPTITGLLPTLSSASSFVWARGWSHRDNHVQQQHQNTPTSTLDKAPLEVAVN